MGFSRNQKKKQKNVSLKELRKETSRLCSHSKNSFFLNKLTNEFTSTIQMQLTSKEDRGRPALGASVIRGGESLPSRLL